MAAAPAPPPTPAPPKTNEYAAVPKPGVALQPGAKSGLIPVDRDALLRTFASYVGIKESPLGSNNGPEVNRFNASCGLSPSDHAPWCASVCHYGYKVNGANDRPGAYSPSWFKKERRIPIDQAEPGDVALVWFPSKGRYAHTICAIEKVNRSGRVVVSFTTLEGNTNAQGSREGDQFARRVRPADSVTVVRWLR